MTIFSNKDVIIVGNSVELMNHNYGKVIDSYDVVVRLGKGFRTEEYIESLGTKTDVWCTGFLRANYHDHRLLKNAQILLNRNRMHLDSPREYDFGDKNIIELFSDEELVAIHKEYNYPKDRRISNGPIALMYFTRKEKSWKSLSIIGMDCFSKSLSFKVGRAKPYSWHMPVNNADYHPHDGEVERQIILEETKNLKNFSWIVLSDFSKKDIL